MACTCVLVMAWAGAACTEPADIALDGGRPGERPDADRGDRSPDAACSAGPDGLDCLFDLIDRAAESCDDRLVTLLSNSLEARVGALAVWHRQRAAFFSRGRSLAIAGEHNGWDTAALTTEPICDSEWYIATTELPPGHYPYKVVDGTSWFLDPLNNAFAFDGFSGNIDGKNSVLNAYESGHGHLVSPPDPLCDSDLGNCRRLTTYLPPGYGAPANADRTYPVIFMHDGQNIFDDPDCCFGHSGWELNRTLDVEIAAGRVDEIIVVGADHAGDARIDEYGVSAAGGGRQEMYMSFFSGTVRETAEARWRIDPARRYTAGSSLGGVIAFRLALAFPDLYAGAASLSGTMWINQDTDTAIADRIEASGHIPVALYLDHGGSAQSGADNYESNVALRAVLEAHGWTTFDSPDCSASPSTACYHHEPGASHDEIAWRDRSWRFLRYFAPAASERAISSSPASIDSSAL